MIHSNANLGVHGQGFLNLSGPGDVIEAQHLVLSLFFSINVSYRFIMLILMSPCWNDENEYCYLNFCLGYI